MKTIKVSDVRNHYTSYGNTVHVVEGELLFLECREGQEFFSSAFYDPKTKLHYIPIIISRLNMPDAQGANTYIQKGDHFYKSDYNGICLAEYSPAGSVSFKILAMPDHFSQKHFQAIHDGKLKEGDKVLVECEIQAYDCEHREIEFAVEKGDYTVKSIKFNNYCVVIHPAELRYSEKDMQKAFEAGQSQANSANRSHNAGYDREHPRYDKNSDLTFAEWLSEKFNRTENKKESVK